MDWQAVAAIAEIIGTAAVVVSIIYLATQVRLQSRESRIASVHELAESFRNSIASFQDPQLAALFARAKDDFLSLPEAERLQFISMVQGLFRVWEDAYHQHQQQRLNDEMWNSMVVQFSGYLSLPGVRSVWAIRKAAYSDHFRAFVDSLAPLEYKSK